MNWRDIHGWSDDIICLYHNAVQHLGDGAVVVEIGTWVGRSTAFMATAIRDSGKQVCFYAIDHGRGSDEVIHRALLPQFNNNVAAAAIINLQLCGLSDYVTYIMGDGRRCSELFLDGSVDFLMLDDNHTYDYLLGEIDDWWPRLKIDGLLCGHDFYPDQETHKGVRQAVCKKFGAGDHRLHPREDWNSCWSIRKTIGGFQPVTTPIIRPRELAGLVPDVVTVRNDKEDRYARITAEDQDQKGAGQPLPGELPGSGGYRGGYPARMGQGWQSRPGPVRL